MERFNKILGDSVFVIQILIVFVLLFESRIEVPPVVQAVGRLHPLLLHLPIGLMLISVVLLFTRRYFEGGGVDQLVSFLLHITAFTASLTTLMGLLLSLEGTFGSDQLFLHKWFGVILSFLGSALLLVRRNARVLKPLALASVVVLIFTGHYGANLTHGEDFVWAPLQPEEKPVTRVITDSTALFTATVEPILESKCYGCHNRKKAKGNLVLTSLKKMREGGKNGPLWEPSDAAHSLLVERLLLPIEDDEHMPPKDKAQLTPEEIRFITMWIDAGADTEKKIVDYNPGDTLMKVASLIIPRYQDLGTGQKYTFRFVSPDKIEALSRPNRSVFQIARNEPAIQADFFLSESYDSKHVEELLSVKEQLISLNLSRMPVKDADLRILNRFENLEVVNLNNTDIQGTGFGELAALPKLRSVSVSGTKVTAEALRSLAKAPALQEIFAWNTSIPQQDLDALAREFPDIRWDTGYKPDETELLKLSAPLLKNKGNVLGHGEKVVLKHNLPGTVIRYTIDGSEPDSLTSPVFKDPLEVGNFSVIKTRAFKDGWLSSDAAEFFFFRKGLQPDSVSLGTSPDERHKGEGARTLVDHQQGLADYYRHPAWLGFRENDLVLNFSFSGKPPVVSNITLSYAHNKGAICLPPDEVQLWGGDDPARLQLIGNLDPPAIRDPGKARIEGVSMDVAPASFRYYRVVAKRMRTLPEGNTNKRTPWLMVDEIFIN